jgi:hypothetical protein
MLRELPDARQFKNESYRRWFSDNYFDLIVWYGTDKTTIVGFQLCYDKFDTERAITWHNAKGFSHNRIDDGEAPFEHAKMSPILVSDGAFAKDTIGDKFKAMSVGIDQKVAEFVCEKIRNMLNISSRCLPETHAPI